MNKLVTTLAVSAFAIALVVPAQANDSRVAALGGDVRLIGDNSDNNIREVFPGYISSFHDVTIEDGGDATVAMAWGDNTLGFEHNNDGDNWLTVLYGTDDFGVAVGIDYAGGGSTGEGDDEVNTPSATGLNLTYGADMFDGDFAAHLGFASTDDGDDDSENDADAMLDLGIGWRGDGMSNFDMMLASMDFHSMGDASSWELELGWGTNHDIGGGMILTGLFVGAEGSADGDDDDTNDAAVAITLPAFVVGCEYGFGGWWGYDATIRASATRSSTMSDGAMAHSATDLVYGMGISNGNLSFDGVVSNNVLKDGPYIVGGNANGMFSSLSVTYAF